MKLGEQISIFNEIRYSYMAIANVDEIKNSSFRVLAMIEENKKRKKQLQEEIAVIESSKLYKRAYGGNGLSRLIFKSLSAEAKPLLAKVKELEQEIKEIESDTRKLKREIKPYAEEVDIIKKYEYITDPKTVNGFLKAFLSKMKYKKEVEHLRPTMYREMYRWVEHLYNIGYKDAVKYEAILLIAEKQVYLTPKERKEYCERRLAEIDGYKYWKEAQNYARKVSVLSSDIKSASSNLTDDEALHAARTMMTANPIDTSGI